MQLFEIIFAILLSVPIYYPPEPYRYFTGKFCRFVLYSLPGN